MACTLTGPPRVAGDLPQARPASAINSYFFSDTVAGDDQTLTLTLGSANALEMRPLSLAAEIFTLPQAAQDLISTSGREGGRPAEVILQVTSTGTWAWLALKSPTAPAPLSVPTRGALGLDPNICTQLVGWDGTRVPVLPKLRKAVDGTLEARYRVFKQVAPQVDDLVNQLLDYAAVGIEGTGLTAPMDRMCQDLQRSFLLVVLDRLASAGLGDGQRQLLQTFAPFSSINCPEPDCSGRALLARNPGTWSLNTLTCAVCGLTLQRDVWAAQIHYHQVLTRPENLRAWWQRLPEAFQTQLHLTGSSPEPSGSH